MYSPVHDGKAQARLQEDEDLTLLSDLAEGLAINVFALEYIMYEPSRYTMYELDKPNAIARFTK